MKRAPILAAVLLAAACGGRAAVVGSPAPSADAAPRPAAPPEVKDPNFVLVVNEVVPNPDDDGVSFTKVFVDGAEAGKTAVGKRSESRALKLKLPAGNRPVRLEQWVLPAVGEWSKLPDGQQPRERFVRIEDGTIATLELHFTEGAETNALTLSRENAPR